MILWRLITQRTPTQLEIWQLYRPQRNQARTGWGGVEELMSKPLCLDLFCKAGGTSRGYQMAGYGVVGVDIEKQPHYIGDDFLQADALEILRTLIGDGCIIGQSGRVYYLEDFTLIAASPPCQAYSESTPMAYRGKHPDLIAPTRELLKATGKPYAIENVEGARAELINPIKLCGSMFGLPFWRHRYFETFPAFMALTPPCNHNRNPIRAIIGGKSRLVQIPVLCTGGGDGQRANRKTHRPRGKVEEIRWAMGIEWMTQGELTEAIPPTYCEYIGKQMLESIRVEA